MNENWPGIVETLIPYFETNSVEGDYQREIENFLDGKRPMEQWYPSIHYR